MRRCTLGERARIRRQSEHTRKHCKPMNRLARLLPFLRWFPMDGPSVRGDIVAGITVALV